MGHRRARGTTKLTVLYGETKIQEKAETLDRFANQFDQLLNMTGKVDRSAVDTIAPRPNITLVDENPELEELLDAISARKEGPLYPHQGGLFHGRNHAGVSWQKGTYVHLPFPCGLI